SCSSLQIFGGLVWILIASSLVPIPLIQGWVMFVPDEDKCGERRCVLDSFPSIPLMPAPSDSQDAAYQCVAALFYLSASVLEALATISMQDGFIYKHYRENIAAVVFSYVATLLYVVHAVFSLIRWKSS
ncbi:myelin and lymphocyte protein, partial [Ictidomys tridecemlineatus]|uniref:myelin and lymphocyte protein n=1 Tax=Ictidomys tridecemlineatus TaxID=43179 RepID=UPI000B53B277